MIINHNLNAMNAHRNMSANNVSSGKAMEKLSSGLRINRAGDDAAGLAISEKMRGQIRGLNQASRNSQDAISMIQTAEGALNETHSILQRMRELAVQAGNDTNESTDREEIQKEINQLTSEINRIANTTEFNNQKLLNATAGSTTSASGTNPAKSSFTMQVGANENQTMTLEFVDMSSEALGIASTSGTTGFTSTNTVTDGTNNTVNAKALDVSSASSAGNAISVIQTAINKVSAERSKLGAYQNRLEHTINNLSTASENMTAAESRIRDVDMAKEMMNFSKNNILSQAAQAMLAQANQQPQGVLQLLR
ncbi:flagellin Hag [Clostridium thermarum]|uniref:flagellin Hag n=1 Tax=Clostridium thermarum TaxID=1716543 RepID=UPI001120AD87|nr:flagellin Hag [Clostridium thermarum]